MTGVLRLAGTDLCITPPTHDDKDVASVRLRPCGGHLQCVQRLRFNAHWHSSEMTAMEAVRNDYPPQQHHVHNAETSGGRGGRIMCWIMTNPANHDTKAVAVRDTWGRHCDKLVFMTTQQDDRFDTWLADLPGPESREMLWAKSKQAWMRTYHDHLHEYDWFIRGDDDSYIMMDNLRQFLAAKDADHPQFFGRLLLAPHNGDTQPFYSGGPGTVVSRAALKAMGDAVDAGEPVFGLGDTFADDLELGLSMAKVGVHPHEVLDEQGRNLFISLGLEAERSLRREDDPDNWYWMYCPTAKEGRQCCSDRWIGTHYATPDEMRALEDKHLAGCEAAGN